MTRKVTRADRTNKGRGRDRSNRAWKLTFLGGSPEPNCSQERGAMEFQIESNSSESSSELVFPLSNTRVGDWMKIAQILSGKKTIDRLKQMGLILGDEVRVISKTKSGSVIIWLRDEQIGLGAGMADKVMVIFTSGES